MTIYSSLKFLRLTDCGILQHRTILYKLMIVFKPNTVIMYSFVEKEAYTFVYEFARSCGHGKAYYSVADTMEGKVMEQLPPLVYASKYTIL